MVAKTTKKSETEGSRDFCLALGKKIATMDDLPAVCEKYRYDVIRRRDTRSSEAIAFEGMNAGSSVRARIARAHGARTEGQLMRRLTHREYNHHKPY
mmetsp:Transcript_2057/g.3644  ORF Transcript_2057/g.3644 Transcript_2057/m.3644 type:complete len:97 (+) Transcript_2057:99-389(+)